jgi:hypothetical protein
MITFTQIYTEAYQGVGIAATYFQGELREAT